MLLYVGMAIALTLLLIFGLSIPISVAIMLAIAMLVVALCMSYTKYVAFLRKDSNRHLFTDCRVTLAEDELREDFSDGSHIAFKLFAITEVREVNNFFFIFATKKHAIVVPRSAFADGDEAQIFAAAVKSRIGRQPS